MKSQILQKQKEKTNKLPSKEFKKLIGEANAFYRSAGGKIRAAYNYATKIDKLEPKVAARILYDNLDYTPQWIRRFLPDEAKSVEKARPMSNKKRAEVKAIRKKKEQEVEKQKVSQTLIQRPVARQVLEIESITVPAEKFKQFLLGLIDIQDQAQKYGVQIHKDLSVELISS